ncbi:MAG: hypothetical protein ACR2PT_06075 [Endozoicomonas sp.]
MKYFFAVMLLLNSASDTEACGKMTDIEVYARRFEWDRPIANANIYAISEGHQSIVGHTDETGFMSIQWPADKELVLFLENSLLGFYPGIHSAHLQPARQKLTGKNHRVTFQVPTYGTYWLLERSMSWRHNALPQPGRCQVVTTITAANKTLDDCPHGYKGARAWLEPEGAESIYYFDVFRTGSLSCKTDIIINLLFYSYINFLYHRLSNPGHVPEVEHLVHQPIPLLNLQQTSEDGGVMFMNVKSSDAPYSIEVKDPSNPDIEFTDVKFMCYPGALINISPPQGPKPVAKSLMRRPGMRFSNEHD